MDNYCKCCHADLPEGNESNKIFYDKLDKIIGGGYYFDGQCEWSKLEGGTICHHHDCIKAYSINYENKRIRDQVKILLLSENKI